MKNNFFKILFNFSCVARFADADNASIIIGTRRDMAVHHGCGGQLALLVWFLHAALLRIAVAALAVMPAVADRFLAR